MHQEISQTQRTHSVAPPTSSFAVLPLPGPKAWPGPWQGKSILQRLHEKTGPSPGPMLPGKQLQLGKQRLPPPAGGPTRILGTPAAVAPDRMHQPYERGPKAAGRQHPLASVSLPIRQSKGMTSQLPTQGSGWSSTLMLTVQHWTACLMSLSPSFVTSQWDG